MGMNTVKNPLALLLVALFIVIAAGLVIARVLGVITSADVIDALIRTGIVFAVVLVATLIVAQLSKQPQSKK